MLAVVPGLLEGGRALKLAAADEPRDEALEGAGEARAVAAAPAGLSMDLRKLAALEPSGCCAGDSFSKLRRKAAAIPPSGCCDSGGGAATGSFSKLRRKAAAVEPAGSVGAAAAAPDLGPAGSGLWAQAWSSCWTDESRATDGMRGSWNFCPAGFDSVGEYETRAAPDFTKYQRKRFRLCH